MADQVTVDNGEGTDYTVSTDDAGASGHVQRVKLALSADGSAAHATVDADGVLVNLGSNNDVTVTGNVAVTNAGLTELAAAIDTELQVDVVGALPAGTNNIGDVDIASIAAGDNNIGNVDVVTLPALPAGNNNIGDVDVASSALPTGASTAANQTTMIGHLDGVEGLLTTIDGDTGTLAGAVAGTEVQVDVVAALPAGTNNIGDVDVLSIAAGDNNIGNVDVVTLPALPAGNNNIGDVDAIQSGTWTVQPGNTANTTAWLVKEQRSGTATHTQVADTASSTTLLSSNASRLGASITNDSSAVLYVKLGTTASATDHAVRMVQYAYYEVPFGYTGRIDGIWATDPGDGAARIVEFT